MILALASGSTQANMLLSLLIFHFWYRDTDRDREVAAGRREGDRGNARGIAGIDLEPLSG